MFQIPVFTLEDFCMELYLRDRTPHEHLLKRPFWHKALKLFCFQTDQCLLFLNKDVLLRFKCTRQTKMIQEENLSFFTRTHIVKMKSGYVLCFEAVYSMPKYPDKYWKYKKLTWIVNIPLKPIQFHCAFLITLSGKLFII